MCSCISQMTSWILSFKASIISGFPAWREGTPQIIVQRCQILAPRWSNDISSAADNAIFRTRALNIECSFGCMTHSAVLLKPNVANILLFNFSEQKFVQHGPITIAIDCNGLSLLIFEQKWPNYSSGLKSAPNGYSFWLRRLFNACLRIFCASNATVFIWNTDFFVIIGIFCMSIAGPLNEAYTQSYSFGGRIKLIICQIRHELSVVIH